MRISAAEDPRRGTARPRREAAGPDARSRRSAAEHGGVRAARRGPAVHGAAQAEDPLHAQPDRHVAAGVHGARPHAAEPEAGEARRGPVAGDRAEQPHPRAAHARDHVRRRQVPAPRRPRDEEGRLPARVAQLPRAPRARGPDPGREPRDHPPPVRVAVRLRQGGHAPLQLPAPLPAQAAPVQARGHRQPVRAFEDVRRHGSSASPRGPAARGRRRSTTSTSPR